MRILVRIVIHVLHHETRVRSCSFRSENPPRTYDASSNSLALVHRNINTMFLQALLLLQLRLLNSCQRDSQSGIILLLSLLAHEFVASNRINKQLRHVVLRTRRNLEHRHVLLVHDLRTFLIVKRHGLIVWCSFRRRTLATSWMYRYDGRTGRR